MRFLLPWTQLIIMGKSVFAVNLFVASYSGRVTSISLTQTPDQKFVLTKLEDASSIMPQPSWLEKAGDLIYVANENFDGPNGSLVSMKASATGQLSIFQDPITSQPGPVSTVLYDDGKALAVAHYAGHAVSNFAVADDGTLSPLQSFVFTTPPGPNPQQEGSHPHQAILDPTGKFIVCPDLGTDQVRVFSIDDSHQLTEQAPLSVAAGSGPRHGVFQETNDRVFFFLITELSNQVLSYSVTYADDSLKFIPVSTGDVLNKPAPKGTASAEIALSPDGNFLVTSARKAEILMIPNPSPNNNTQIPSDTLQSWAIDSNTGALTFKQLAPAGGRNPRHFSISPDGTMVAVALQGDGRVVIYQRSVEDGNLGDVVAAIDLEGELTNVLWDQ